MRKNYFYLAVIFVVAFVFFALHGCKAVLGEGSVSFSLPEWDESLGVRLEYWRVRTSDGSGEKSVLAGNLSRSVTLDVDFEKVTAIVAYPITNIDADDASPFFKPAGCIYPYQDAMSYLHGFSSELLREFYAYNANYSPDEVSTFAKKFNWQKFMSIIEAKAQEAKNNAEDAQNNANSAGVTNNTNIANAPSATNAAKADSKPFYNPWNCDYAKIFSGMQNASFSTSYVNQATSNLAVITLDDVRSASKGQDISAVDSLLCSYIPENSANGEFVLPYNEQCEFISLDKGMVYEIFITFLKKDRRIVLAINSIPL